MEEKNNNQTLPGSVIKRQKERNMLKRQRLMIILMIGAILILLAALFTVKYFVEIYRFEDLDGTRYRIQKVDGSYALCYQNGDVCDQNTEGYYQTDLGTLVQINGKDGSAAIYAVVDTEGTEVVGYGQYVMMFKQLTYDASATKDASKVIDSIEVHNEYGGYTFLRQDGEGKINNFVIEGHESVVYAKETFAQLAVACGYTLSARRLDAPKKLETGEIDLCEYGLAPEKRIKTVTDEEGNQTQVEYDYEPAWYVITTASGDRYKVTLGDLIVTGGGYYAMYEGRDTIYVLGTSGFSDVLLQKVENVVSPMIVYPMGTTTYHNVHDFVIYKQIDYAAVYAALEERFGDPDSPDYAPAEEEAVNAYYWEMLDKHSQKACHFSYQELEEREGSMYSYLPYVSHLEYADGYYINSNNIDQVLFALFETDFTTVEKLAPTAADTEKYGLDEAAYVLSYLYKTTVDGQIGYIPNLIEISEKNENGIYYVYSSMYDMIVGVSESSFGFLEWEELTWYDPSYIQLDLSHVEKISVESPDFSVHFEIEDSVSKYMTYIARSGSSFKEGNLTYTIEKDPLTGSYTLMQDSKPLSAAHAGDYMIAPLAYIQGTPESSDYLFVESAQVDVDGDGNKDATAYYYYNVVKTQSGEYVLMAYVAIADDQGNKLGEKTMQANVAYSTEYFLTNSNYLYLTSKDSYIGQELEKTYGSKRGKWGNCRFFITAEEKYVMVDDATGKWSILDDISCNLYLGDSETSRLAQRAVKIPAAYGAQGQLIRHGETYYPLTNEDLQYNEETGKIQVYNTKQQVWENATYSDCTVGVWNSGAYYVTENKNIIVVNRKTGDWGFATVSASENYVAEILADGKLLNYVIDITNHVGRPDIATAADNFKQFYGGMLYASLEGMAELSGEEKEALSKLDNFTAETAEGIENNPCQLKITIYGCDLQGNRRDVVYRFYQYTERKSYLTVELLASPNAPSSSTDAYGSFYVLRSFADKMIEDAQKIVNAQEVKAVTKY